MTAVAEPATQPLKIPHAFTLLFSVAFVCAILTYFLPSGAFDREVKMVDSHPRTLVVPGSYTPVPKHYSLQAFLFGEAPEGTVAPESMMGLLTAPPRGLEKTADIIFFLFMIGGTMGVLRYSQLITASIQFLLRRFGGSDRWVTALLIFLMSIGSSTMGMSEEYVALIPVFLVLAYRLGYDRIYGLSMVLIPSVVGFACSTTNPFTIHVAQGIAELPINSGILLRVLFFICCVGTSILYLLRYGSKVRANPEASLAANLPCISEDHKVEEHRFRRSHVVTMLTCGMLFIFTLFAVQAWDWGLREMSGIFFLMGIVTIAICRLDLHASATAFSKGMEDMVVPALCVGFARAIEVVLSDGMIMDTVIYYSAKVLEQLPEALAAQGILIFQAVLNIFIPSGSGQAALTMPIITPLADSLGLTRQVAVFAFQCGDGFSNMLIPTSGELMAMLAIAKVPFGTWLRYAVPLFAILMAWSAIFLAAGVILGYQ